MSESHRYVTLALAVSVLTVVVLMARSGGRSWVSVNEPHTLRLVEGQTVEYESSYFDGVLRGFLGSPLPSGFTSAHYRFWLPQTFAAALLRWSGSTYWSLALTDLLGALAGSVGIVWLGRTLRLGLAATGVAAAAYALSPVVVGYMWRNQLHVQAVGSIAWGSAASVCLLATAGETTASPARRSLAGILRGATLLGLVWLAVSWQYQFHFVLIPTLLCLALCERAHLGPRIAVWCGASLVFLGLTTAAAALLATAGLPVVAENNDPRGALEAFATHAPSWSDQLRRLGHPLQQVAATYHPIVAGLALAGLLVLPRRALVYCGATLIITIGFLVVRNIDRVAHAASPAIYLSAAAAVTRLPGWLSIAVNRLSARPVLTDPHRGLMLGVLAALLSWTLLIQNGDLWGNFQALAPSR